MSFSAHRCSWVNKRSNKRLNDVSTILQKLVKKTATLCTPESIPEARTIKIRTCKPKFSRKLREKEKENCKSTTCQQFRQLQDIGYFKMDFAQFTNFGTLRCIALRRALYNKPLAYTISRTLDQSNYLVLMVKQLSRDIKIVYFRI